MTTATSPPLHPAATRNHPAQVCQVVDARDPLRYRCEDLEEYVDEACSRATRKRNLGRILAGYSPAGSGKLVFFFGFL